MLKKIIALFLINFLLVSCQKHTGDMIFSVNWPKSKLKTKNTETQQNSEEPSTSLAVNIE